MGPLAASQKRLKSTHHGDGGTKMSLKCRQLMNHVLDKDGYASPRLLLVMDENDPLPSIKIIHRLVNRRYGCFVLYFAG